MIQYPITVLHRGGLRLWPPVPVHAWADTAVARENNHMMWVLPLDRSMAGTMMTTNGEGVSWIHGHHNNDSPEVLAMLAAWALTCEQS